jgi:conjugal transfer pilus assembly protein TraA
MKKRAAVCASLFPVAVAAMAGNGSSSDTTFNNIFNWINSINSIVTGSAGKTIALAAAGIGAFMTIGRGNPIPILTGVGFAIFLLYILPSVITTIFSATI